jgi:hypothetical protein
LALEPKP